MAKPSQLDKVIAALDAKQQIVDRVIAEFYAAAKAAKPQTKKAG